MDSLDTNLLVRYYVDDDPAQADIAEAVLNGAGPLFVAASVVAELAWVLENARYRLSRRRVVDILRHLLAISAVHVEHEAQVMVAIDAYEQGLDFGDALHLAASSRCDRLLTFDRRFVSRVKRLGLTPACELASGAI